MVTGPLHRNRIKPFLRRRLPYAFRQAGACPSRLYLTRDLIRRSEIRGPMNRPGLFITKALIEDKQQKIRPLYDPFIRFIANAEIASDHPWVLTVDDRIAQ